jgi:hypothetical protein
MVKSREKDSILERDEAGRASGRKVIHGQVPPQAADA